MILNIRLMKFIIHAFNRFYSMAFLKMAIYSTNRYAYFFG